MLCISTSCVHTCLWICIWGACVCSRKPEDIRVVPGESSMLIFWDRVSLLAWSLLISSDWLVSELQRSSCPYLPRLVFKAHITMLDFYMTSGDWTQFLLLARHMLCWLSSYLRPGEMLFRSRDDMRLEIENKCFGSQIQSLKDFSSWAWLAGMSRIEFKIRFLPKTKISLSSGHGSSFPW